MNILDTIRSSLGALRTRVSYVAMAARGVLPRRVYLSSEPPTESYSEPDPRSSIDWTPALIKAAERSADAGDMGRAASLCEAMLADERVSGCLIETRVKGLLGLALRFEKPDGATAKADAIAIAAEQDWWTAFPEDKVSEWMAWGILLGIGVARAAHDEKGEVKPGWLEVERDGGWRVVPQLDVIHPSALRQDTRTRQWYARQADGSEVKVTPGDGTWFVYTPYGTKRPWARGAWRSLALWWLLKRYAQADWARYSERHGMGLFVGRAPDGADPKHRKALGQQLSQIARDSEIALPPGYSVELVESTANTWSTYKAQTDVANTAIAVRILGQNLSTEVTGGSYAAAQTHARVAASYIRADDETSRTTLYYQAWALWAEFNFGDRALAPWPKRDTTPPEDKAAKATTKKAAADAATTWVNLGAPVDIKAEAEDVGVHLLEGQDVRPPMPPKGAPAGLSRTVQLASGDRVSVTSGFVEGQEYADRLAAQARDKASGELSPWIDQVLAIIDGIEDGPDWHRELRRKLVDAYGEGPGIDSVTERALVLAELAGRTAVLQDLG